MASSSLYPSLSTLPHESETEPSSSSEQGICMPFDEAIEKLPLFMQSKDEHEQHKLEMFLSQVDELHQPDGRNASATLILDYILRILESAPQRGEVASQEGTFTRSEAFDSLPELPVQLPIVTGDIATEIASKASDNVDSHNIAISVLNILQKYSWETKVALTVTTYILTFGDFGLNLCAESKVTLNNISMFIKQLLEITSYIVEFEKLPTAYMTSTDPNIKDGRTHLIVAIYWIIRAVMDNAASHIMTISSIGYKFGTAISPPSDEKLEAIGSHLKTKLIMLQELLEENLDIEVYNRIKKIVNEEEHSDNLKVLNVLFSSSDDAPRLYDGSTEKRVGPNVLKGKYVLLLITDLDVNHHELSIIDQIQVEGKDIFNYELVFIPVVDRSLQRRIDSTEIKYRKLRSFMNNCYTVENPRMIKNEVIKLFKDDWNFMLNYNTYSYLLDLVNILHLLNFTNYSHLVNIIHLITYGVAHICRKDWHHPTPTM